MQHTDSSNNDKQRKRPVKYILVTGGVVSSLGKGLASASIGNLMESRGLKITFLKLDPISTSIPAR